MSAVREARVGRCRGGNESVGACRDRLIRRVRR